jgi:hypothetical protein
MHQPLIPLCAPQQTASRSAGKAVYLQNRKYQEIMRQSIRVELPIHFMDTEENDDKN